MPKARGKQVAVKGGRKAMLKGAILGIVMCTMVCGEQDFEDRNPARSQYPVNYQDPVNS